MFVFVLFYVEKSVSDAGGSLQVQTIAEKPLKQDMLKSEDCFILDTPSGIYVWVGKKATKQEKDQAMVKGTAVSKVCKKL